MIFKRTPLFFLLITLSIFIFSCTPPKDVIYLENVQSMDVKPSTTVFDPVFKPDDVVSVLVSSPDMDAVRPFNLSQGLAVSRSSIEEPSPNNSPASTYLIDSNGNIEFPVLGTIKLGGLTRIEAKKLFNEKLQIYIKNPIVNIRITNFKITVMGEVMKPGTFIIPNERVTILEAIGLAGDMNIKGKRKNILVVRDEGGLNQFYRLDVTSQDVFDSPAYYLEQNDVVYVEPNKSRVKNSGENRNTAGLLLSITGVLLSAITLIVRY